jgi:hypothetical protein
VLTKKNVAEQKKRVHEKVNVDTILLATSKIKAEQKSTSTNVDKKIKTEQKTNVEVKIVPPLPTEQLNKSKQTEQSANQRVVKFLQPPKIEPSQTLAC